MEDLALNSEDFLPSQANVEALKEMLKDKALLLRAKEELRQEQEAHLEATKREIARLKMEIEHTWSPFVSLSSVSTLDMGEISLERKEQLGVVGEDQEVYIEWLSQNGYKDVLKLQVHHATLKSIAKELYNNESIEIPGISYSKFFTIKIK